MKKTKIFSSIMSLALVFGGALPLADGTFQNNNVTTANAALNNNYIKKNYKIPEWYDIDLNYPVWQSKDYKSEYADYGFDNRFKIDEFFPDDEFINDEKYKDYKCAATIIHPSHVCGITSVYHVMVPKDTTELDAYVKNNRFKFYRKSTKDIKYIARQQWKNKNKNPKWRESEPNPSMGSDRIYSNLPINIYSDTKKTQLVQKISPYFPYGDISGDGNINITDISELSLYLQGEKKLSGRDLKAADVNHDGEVNYDDLSALADHIKGIKPISQAATTTTASITTTLTTTVPPTTTTTITAVDLSKIDSDQDGFTNDIDPNPYVKDEFLSHTIKNQNYIQVEYTGPQKWKNWDGSNLSYGGSQKWIIDYVDFDSFNLSDIPDAVHCDAGCGVSPVVDVLTYLQTEGLNDKTCFNYDSYSNYRDKIMFILPVYPKLGVIPIDIPFDNKYGSATVMEFLLNGVSIDSAVNIKAASKVSVITDSIYKSFPLIEGPYNVKWAPTNNKDECLPLIEEMLDNDIPVICSYFSLDNKIAMYAPPHEKPAISEYNMINYKEVKESVGSHYMVITGIVDYSEDVKNNLKRPDGNQYETMLQVASWGRKYYISLSDFLDEFGWETTEEKNKDMDFGLGTSIMLIRKS